MISKVWVTSTITHRPRVRRLGRLLCAWGAVVAFLFSPRAEAVAKPRAILANFTGPNAEEMRTAVARALSRQIDLVTDLEPVPKIHGRVFKQGGKWSLRLAVRDAKGAVLADETYGLTEQRLYRSMPVEMADVVEKAGTEGGAAAAVAPWDEQVFVGATIGVSQRTFKLTKADPAGAALPAYAGSNPVLRLSVLAHPATWLDLRNGIVRAIGLALLYEAGPKVESKVEGQNGAAAATYQAGSSQYEASLFYRLVLGSDTVIRPRVGLGARRFEIEGMAGPPIPTVEYSYKTFGVDADVPLPLLERKLGLVAGGQYMMLDGLQGVSQFAKTAKGSAYGFFGGARYRLPYRVEAAVLYEMQSFSVEFAGAPAGGGGTARSGADQVSIIGARMAIGY